METKQCPLRLTLLKKLEIEKAISDKLAKKSLYHFCKTFWHIIEPGKAFVDGWHIKAICDHLEKVTEFDLSKLIINMPPRHMKSIITCVMWPAWVWGKYPERRFIFASYSQGLALRDSIKCRQVLSSSEYIRIFNPTWKLIDDQNTKSLFQNSMMGFRKAVGVATALQGDGADYLVIDDPTSAQDGESKAVCDQVANWHDSTFSTRYNDPDKHAKVIVMQRLSDKDLTHHVTEQGHGYLKLVLPAEYDPDSEIKSDTGFVDPRTSKGDLLWPERFHVNAIADLKNTLGHNAEAQLNQDPKTDGKGLFPEECWQYYDKSPSEIIEIVQFWDCAQKPGITNDYSVCATWARTRNSFYRLDLWREKVDGPTLEAMVQQKYGEFLPSEVVIEDKSSGSSLIQYIRRNTTIPVIAFNPRGDKEVRAISASTSVKAGKCFLPIDDKMNKVFIDEHKKFPKAKHDDQVDTTSMMTAHFNAKVLSAPRVRSLSN